MGKYLQNIHLYPEILCKYLPVHNVGKYLYLIFAQYLPKYVLELPKCYTYLGNDLPKYV